MLCDDIVTRVRKNGSTVGAPSRRYAFLGGDAQTLSLPNVESRLDDRGPVPSDHNVIAVAMKYDGRHRVCDLRLLCVQRNERLRHISNVRRSRSLGQRQPR